MPPDRKTQMTEDRLGWTLDTLKTYIEARFSAIEALHAKDVFRIERDKQAGDDALKLQAKEYERRLDALNGEQSRIAATQATYIGRELWERFQEDDRLWKNRIELSMQTYMRTTDFNTYKEGTDKALTLKAGQSQGFDMVRVTMTFVAGLVVAGIAFWAATKGLR